MHQDEQSLAQLSEPLVACIFLFSPMLLSFQGKFTSMNKNMGSSLKGFIRPMARVVDRLPTETQEDDPVALDHSDFIFNDPEV